MKSNCQGWRSALVMAGALIFAPPLLAQTTNCSVNESKSAAETTPCLKAHSRTSEDQNPQHPQTQDAQLTPQDTPRALESSGLKTQIMRAPAKTPQSAATESKAAQLPRRERPEQTIYYGPWQPPLSPEELRRQILYAAEMGGLPQIKQLLALGVPAKDNDFLHVAVKHGAVEVARFFLEQGGDANFQPRDGSSCRLVGIAAARADREMLRLLVEHGANVNLDEGKSNVDSPLLCSVYRGRVAAVKLLVEFGARVNAQNKNRNSALSQALTHTDANAEEIVKLLIDLGADPDLIDGDNFTPREFARLRMPQARAWMDQAKPAPRKAYPVAQPQFSFGLDQLDQKTFDQVAGFELFGRFIPDPSAFRADRQADKPAIYYFDELVPSLLPNCPAAKGYLAGTSHGHQGRVILALCGAGPFDEFQIADTLQLARRLARVDEISQRAAWSGDEKTALAFADFFADQQAGAGLRLVSMLMPFVTPDRDNSPTCAVVDSGKHFSLVAQLRGSYFEGLTGSKLRALCKKLYDQLNSTA